MSKLECSICLEQLKIKKYFQCEHCKKNICKICLKECLIEYGDNIPKCPDCKTSIPFESLAKLYSKKFVKEDLVEHMAKIQFEVLVKEKSKLIIETLSILCQDLTNHEKHKRLLTLNRYYDYYRGLNSKTYKIGELIGENFEPIFIDFMKYITNVDNNMNDLNKELEAFTKVFTLINIDTRNKLLDKYYKPLLDQNIKGKYLDSYTEYGLKSRISKELETKSKGGVVEYLLRCTNCEFGFITSNYKCNQCNKVFCNKCLVELNEIHDSSHDCKQNDIDNLNFILSQTKPCPNCYTRISKISGCNQMFCTFCHKGFDWVTGKIITSNFHNPHRMEWLRNGGIDSLNELDCVNNYRYQILGKTGVTSRIDKLLNYRNYCLDINNRFTFKLEQTTNESNELTNLAMYLYNEYYQKHPDYKVTKHLMLTKNKFLQFIKQNETHKFKYRLYIETYQNIIDLCDAVLIRIDQILIRDSIINEFMNIVNDISNYNQSSLSTKRMRMESMRIYGDKINIENFNISLSKKYTDEIKSYISKLTEVETLLINCYKLLKEIETKRINELEKYLDLCFERFVYDECPGLNLYSWSTKYGFNSLQEIMTWYKILIKEPSKDYVKYDKIKITPYTKTYKKIKYLEHVLYLRNYSYQNVYKLNVSDEEKIIIYNILVPK